MNNDWFPDAVGQDGLKRELYEAYEGGRKAGLPMPHGFLIGPPGCGKSAQFVPGIARMTGFIPVGPYGMSLGMTLDDVLDEVETKCVMIQVEGERPLIVLEELSNIGRPNAARLLTLLSEGYFTRLDGETWQAGVPGRDFLVVATSNDDGNLPEALKSRLTYFRFEPYSCDVLAEIGEAYVERIGAEYGGSFADLLTMAERLDFRTPRLMLASVRRALALTGLGEKAGADEVTASFRLDADGLHLDLRRVLVALLDLGGKASYEKLTKHLRCGKQTLVGWMAELGDSGYVSQGANGGGATRLTSQGKRKAAEIRLLNQ